VTVYRWVHRFAPEFAEAAAARRHIVGDRWHVDETYLKVGGTWRYLFRAIDQFGQVIDVLLSPRRDTAAAHRLFDRAIGRTRISPVEVIIDRYRVYPRVLDELLPAWEEPATGGRSRTVSEVLSMLVKDIPRAQWRPERTKPERGPSWS
jgi:transposase-like protein